MSYRQDFALHFTHPNKNVGNLYIGTGVNEFTWSYKLNTQSYPTYAGEVVQILSCYIDTLTITGDVRTYQKMEQIYGYFLKYMQFATQGGKGTKKGEAGYGQDKYVEEPMTVHYPQRGWTLKIQPISLPGLKYSTDTVAPQWQLQAAVLQVGEDSDEMVQLSLGEAAKNQLKGVKGMSYVASNPFSDPLAAPQGRSKKASGSGGPSSHPSDLSDLADAWNQMVQSLKDGDVGALVNGISKPASNSADPTSTTSGTKRKKGGSSQAPSRPDQTNSIAPSKGDHIATATGTVDLGNMRFTLLPKYVPWARNIAVHDLKAVIVNQSGNYVGLKGIATGAVIAPHYEAHIS